MSYNHTGATFEDEQALTFDEIHNLVRVISPVFRQHVLILSRMRHLRSHLPTFLLSPLQPRKKSPRCCRSAT